MKRCRICNSDVNQNYSVREMMLGLRETFNYFHCNNCGCFQIAEIPNDLTRYYPKDYYSFVDLINLKNNNRWLKRILTNDFLKNSYLPRVFYKYYKPLPRKLEVFKGVGISTNESVLDVGCGSGALLKSMYNNGFSNLTGIDPYLHNDVIYNSNLRLLKRELSQINGQFSFIMLNHSLEHMEDQHATFEQLSKLLSPNGLLMVRIPIIPSFFWKKYGVNWIELDAPRHLYIHSFDSLKMLLKHNGLILVKTLFDTTEFEILGSIQYENDISLNDKRSYTKNLTTSIFNKSDIVWAKKLAHELNKNADGGRACFFIRKENNI